jgi:exosortase/archaeosortase family protein
VPALLVLAYAGVRPFVPPLLAALVAMAALGSTYSAWRHGTPWPSARWGLVLLSVPMLTSVHFYLGFPLRVITGAIASFLLRLSGFNVVREGVCLRWSGRLVMIDTPCSGVRMLWAAMFLVLVLACRKGLGPARALLAAAGAVAAVVLGNALRTTALFFPEAGIVQAPPILHPAVGVAVFVMVALAIVRSLPRPAVAR